MIGAFLAESDKRSVDEGALAARGVRIEQPWHISLYAAMKGMHESLKALRGGKAPAELWPTLTELGLMGELPGSCSMTSGSMTF